MWAAYKTWRIKENAWNSQKTSNQPRLCRLSRVLPAATQRLRCVKETFCQRAFSSTLCFTVHKTIFYFHTCMCIFLQNVKTSHRWTEIDLKWSALFQMLQGAFQTRLLRETSEWVVTDSVVQLVHTMTSGHLFRYLTRHFSIWNMKIQYVSNNGSVQFVEFLFSWNSIPV